MLVVDAAPSIAAPLRKAKMQTLFKGHMSKMTLRDAKQSHSQQRNLDRNQRNVVTSHFQASGAVSNLYPVIVEPSASVHCYEIQVKKKTSSGVISVAPTSAWRVFSRFLQNRSSAPHVQVGNRIYSQTPFPVDALKLPHEFHDLSWQSCSLVPGGQLKIQSLSDDERQHLLNKLLPWAVTDQKGFSSVRERDGKVTCTDSGIEVGGLYIFNGVTAHALFTTNTNVNLPLTVTTTTDLSSVVSGFNETITFTVFRVEEALEVSGRSVKSFTIRDASRSIVLRVWDQPALFLEAGATYKAALIGVPGGGGELELQGIHSSTFESVVMQEPNSVTNYRENLSVRLDTKCTVLSERSLWDEVKHHFGPPPYSRDVQHQINAAVERMPVVASTSLKHGVVRIVSFSVKSYCDVPLDSDVIACASVLEPNQPFAILNDFSVWPLQALHCCFDPTVRAWQDISVASCSFFPAKRLQLLSTMRDSLATGLDRWGIELMKNPLVTHDVAVLRPVQKPKGYQKTSTGARPLLSLPSSPSDIFVVGVPGSRASSKTKDLTASTVAGMAHAFSTPHALVATSEVEAIRLLDESLQQVTSVAPLALLFTTNRDSRAAYWLRAQALKRGVVPLLAPPTLKTSLLAGNLRRNIQSKFTVNPASDVAIHERCPFLARKRVLCVGIDTCHTDTVSTGAAVGLLITPTGNLVIPQFWRNDVRGQEVENVTNGFKAVIDEAATLAHGLDEIVVFQDGNVFSELQSMKSAVPADACLTFLCLHKRTNIRFHFDNGQIQANHLRGTIIQSLTPASRNSTSVAPSFFVQAHDSNMSTARGVQYTVHAQSPKLSLTQVQDLTFALSHLHTILPTKLPFPTRCAHRLSSMTERLIDACPDFSPKHLNDTIRHRLWFI